MGLFDVFKKAKGPYKDDSTNRIYELLFCDYDLYKSNSPSLDGYPWNVLFSTEYDVNDINNIIANNAVEPRVKLLAYKAIEANGGIINDTELLAVIVEVALEDGLDVLASFKDGTARYINQSGKILVWENDDNISNVLTKQLFEKSSDIIKQIGPWDEARKPYPQKGMLRISFLVSNKLYFGEGPIDVLFNDGLAGPALLAATNLMKYITEKALQQ
jgi:hypothetical protein